MTSYEQRSEYLRPVNGDRFAELQQLVRTLSTPDENGLLRMQDEYQQGYLQALDSRLGDERFPVTNRLYRNALRAYSERPTINIINNGIRCGNAYFLRKYPYDIARLGDLDVPEGWDEYFAALEDDTDPVEIARFANYFEFNVQTTVPQRGAVVVASAYLLGRENPLSVMDIGHGRGHVLGAMALSEREFQYEPIEVFLEDDDGNITRQPKLDNRFNTLVNRTFELAPSIGIDIQQETGTSSVRNIELRDWAAKNFYISEYITNFKRVIDFWMMEDAMSRIPQITFFQGDITSKQFQSEFKLKHPDFQADIALFSVICEQLGIKGTSEALKNVGPFVKEDGLKIVTTFGTMQPNGEIDLADFWPPWSLRTYAEDARQPDLGMQHLFTMYNGRVNKVALTPIAARLMLDHA